MSSRPVGYPEHRVVDVNLRDGSTVRVRPVVPEDVYDIVDLFERVSPASTRMRFHGSVHLDRSGAERFATVDYKSNFGLIAETSRGDGGRAVALANYMSIGAETAEMAILVDDPFHGRGLGSILVEHLTEAAVEAGIGTFVAEVMGENAGMLEVLRET